MELNPVDQVYELNQDDIESLGGEKRSLISYSESDQFMRRLLGSLDDLSGLDTSHFPAGPRRNEAIAHQMKHTEILGKMISQVAPVIADQMTREAEQFLRTIN